MEGFIIKTEPGAYIPVHDHDDDDSTNDEVIRQFIEAYEALPELWNTQHPAYTHKNVRNVALDKLARIYSKIKPGADRDDVRRKINTLRSNYRKELKKLAERNAFQELYKPTSWVFHALKFLYRYEDTNNTYLREEVNQYHFTELHHGPPTEPVHPKVDTFLRENLGPPSRPSTSSEPPSPPPTKKKPPMGPIAKQNELLSLACQYLEKTKTEENIPTIARVWGEKLVALDPDQKLFAEKAINDVLFEASLGNLHRYSVKINEDRPRYLNERVIEHTRNVQ